MSDYKNGEFSYAGWGQEDRLTHELHFSVCIGHLPGRKSLVLYLMTPGLLRPLAYFRSVEDAERAAKYLGGLILNELVEVKEETKEWLNQQ